MKALDEIQSLMTLEPERWSFSYGLYSKPRELLYNQMTVADFLFIEMSDNIPFEIRIYPGGTRLNWWQRRRMMGLVRDFAAHTYRRFAKEVAQQVLRRQEDTIKEELKRLDKELDGDLMAQFAALETGYRKEQAMVAEAPVTTGFLKGITNRTRLLKHGKEG